MLTTIQIHKETKDQLESIKEKNESFEDVIERLIEKNELEKRMNKKRMIEGWKEMAEESLRITKEWEPIDNKLDWEW